MATQSELRSAMLRKKFYENKYEQQRPGMFMGTNYVTGAQLEAMDEHKRALELQQLKNQGEYNVADRNQTGATNRTGMTEAGAGERLGMTEDRLLARLGFDKEKFGQEFQQQVNESDEDFLFRMKKQKFEEDKFRQENALARDYLGFKKDTADRAYGLEKFKALNPTTSGAGELAGLGNTFSQNRLNMMLMDMTPEAAAAFRTRLETINDPAAQETSPATQPVVNRAARETQYQDNARAAQTNADVSAIGTDLGRAESTRQMQSSYRGKALSQYGNKILSGAEELNKKLLKLKSHTRENPVFEPLGY